MTKSVLAFDSMGEIAVRLEKHKTTFGRFDVLWSFFIEQHLQSGASSADVCNFWKGLIPYGIRNVRLILWAWERHEIEDITSLGRKLRDLANDAAANAAKARQQESETAISDQADDVVQ